MKHFLDFLIDEGFDIVQIANKPRILASSQKTVKKRLEQLRQLGVTDINLNLLCRSKKDFRRICFTLGLKDGKFLRILYNYNLFATIKSDKNSKFTTIAAPVFNKC